MSSRALAATSSAYSMACASTSTRRPSRSSSWRPVRRSTAWRSCCTTSTSCATNSTPVAASPAIAPRSGGLRVAPPRSAAYAREALVAAARDAQDTAARTRAADRRLTTTQHHPIGPDAAFRATPAGGFVVTGDLREQVLAVVRERKPISGNAVVATVRGHRADVLAALRACEAAGLV